MSGDYRQHAPAVYERDGWTCRLCGLPVAKNRQAPHPLSPSLDHIKPQVLGGSDDPENLQTAHMFCNISKHVRPERGSVVKIAIGMTPELRELVERLDAALPPQAPSEPDLPALSPDTIGDAFDRALRLAEDEQSSRLPSLLEAVEWALAQGFVSDDEARAGLFGQAYACLDEAAMHVALGVRLRREVPQAWFIPEFLGEGENPARLEDELGWEDCATALLDRIGVESVDRFVQEASAAYASGRGDPLDRLGTVLDGTGDDRPGQIQGHDVSAYESVLRDLKRACRDADAESLAVRLLPSLEAGYKAGVCNLSPWYYEQVAILRRKRGDLVGEVEVLERYFAQLGPKDWPSGVLAQRLERAKAKLAKEHRTT